MYTLLLSFMFFGVYKIMQHNLMTKKYCTEPLA